MIDGPLRRDAPGLKIQERLITIHRDQRAFASSVGIEDQTRGHMWWSLTGKETTWDLFRGHFQNSRPQK